MPTKKLLAPFDPRDPDKITRDFLMPDLSGSKPALVSIAKAVPSDYGFTVYIGQEISTNDFLKRLIDSSDRRIESVHDTIALVDDYLAKVSLCKIGDVVQIAHDPDAPLSYSLRKVSVKRHRRGPKLP